MSSTYVSGYRAWAFPTLSGFAYCLFNETAESNLHPRVPHWSAHQIGTLQDLGGRIVQFAYCCDDGSTRGPGGGYLKERNSTMLGASAACLREFRKWEKEERESVSFKDLSIEAALLDQQSDYARRCANELAGGAQPAGSFEVAEPQAAWQYLHMAGCQLDFRVHRMARAPATLF